MQDIKFNYTESLTNMLSFKELDILCNNLNDLQYGLSKRDIFITTALVRYLEHFSRIKKPEIELFKEENGNDLTFKTFDMVQQKIVNLINHYKDTENNYKNVPTFSDVINSALIWFIKEELLNNISKKGQ